MALDFQWRVFPIIDSPESLRKNCSSLHTFDLIKCYTNGPWTSNCEIHEVSCRARVGDHLKPLEAPT